MKQFFLIVILFVTSQGFGQIKKAKPSFAYTERRDGYFYIPRKALSNKYNAILTIDFGLDSTIKIKKVFNFWWVSNCNDGYFNLTITPEQIFFCSSHDNPNPDFLFWVINIDSVQYKEIAQALKDKTPRGFTDESKFYRSKYDFVDNFKDNYKMSEHWTDKKEKAFDTYCAKQKARQLHKYFLILNAYIKQPKEKLRMPTKAEIQLIKPKYFSFDKENIIDWMPTKFIFPKLKVKSSSIKY